MGFEHAVGKTLEDINDDFLVLDSKFKVNQILFDDEQVPLFSHFGTLGLGGLTVLSVAITPASTSSIIIAYATMDLVDSTNGNRAAAEIRRNGTSMQGTMIPGAGAFGFHTCWAQLAFENPIGSVAAQTITVDIGSSTNPPVSTVIKPANFAATLTVIEFLP